MPKEISASEYERMVGAGKTSGPKKDGSKIVAAIAVAIILCGLSFLGGVQYQKGHAHRQMAGTQAGAGFRGRGGFRTGQRPVIGTVTAVSSDSLTINNNRTGNSQTFKISSTTTINNNGSTSSVSDIKNGDTVFVQTSSSDTSTATRIILNPSFGGQPAGSTTTQ